MTWADREPAPASDRMTKLTSEPSSNQLLLRKSAAGFGADLGTVRRALACDVTLQPSHGGLQACHFLSKDPSQFRSDGLEGGHPSIQLVASFSQRVHGPDQVPDDVGI
jgi:hypothetical protein